MSTPTSEDVAALPTFAALDSFAVLDDQRRGASIQVDESYFRGQQEAIDASDTASALSKRRTIATQSHQLYDQIQIDFDSLTEETLETASARFRQVLQQMPELQFLKQQFPETCFIVPEWLRTEGAVNYGARIYFFRDEEAADPDEIVRRNIQAVVHDDREQFEQYKGQLHGYPDCCIEYFSAHDRQQGTAPELEAIEPIADYIDDSRIQGSDTPSTSIDDIIAGLFETPDVYAFFAREFFPEPGCTRARRRGISIYESLTEQFPEKLVNDYFRLNAGWSYLMAQAITSAGAQSTRPSPGSLGREHLLFYLPLASIQSVPRYTRE